VGVRVQSDADLLRRRTLILYVFCRFLFDAPVRASDVLVLPEWYALMNPMFRVLCDTYDCNCPGPRGLVEKRLKGSGWPRLLRLGPFSWDSRRGEEGSHSAKANTFWLTMYGSWMSRMSSLRLFTIWETEVMRVTVV